MLPGRQGSILTCPEVPDSQKGGLREYPYRFATAVHIHGIRGGWVDPRAAVGGLGANTSLQASTQRSRNVQMQRTCERTYELRLCAAVSAPVGQGPDIGSA